MVKFESDVISSPFTAKSPVILRFPLETSRKKEELESVPPTAKSSPVSVKYVIVPESVHKLPDEFVQVNPPVDEL